MRGYETKQKAIDLRKEGLSYSEISKELGVAKSTLTVWFKGFVGESDIKKKNIDHNRAVSKDRLAIFTQNRKKTLDLKYENAVQEASISFNLYKNDSLFVAGLMLYAGEGDNKTRCHIRLSNTDWKIHRIFIEFVIKYLGYSREAIRCQLVIYPDLIKYDVEKFWSDTLGISTTHFYKTQIIKGKSKRRLQFGVCMTIINNTHTKYKLLEWIRLFKDAHAGLV